MTTVIRHAITAAMIVLALALVIKTHEAPRVPAEPGPVWQYDRDTHLITAYDTSPFTSPSPTP